MMDDLVLEVKWPAIYLYEVFSEMVKVEYILTYEYGACTYTYGILREVIPNPCIRYGCAGLV